MNSCRVLVKHSEQALGCFLAADRSMMGGEALPIDVVLPRSISKGLSNHLSIYNTASGIRGGVSGIGLGSDISTLQNGWDQLGFHGYSFQRSKSCSY